MNQSKPGAASGSGGFVYFSNEEETDDFIPFSNPTASNSSPYNARSNPNYGNKFTSPQTSQFNPAHCSSPFEQKRKYSSPGGFQNKRRPYNQSRGNYSGNASFNKSGSANKSFNTSGSSNRSFNTSGNRSFNTSGHNSDAPIENYFHPSMLEDPWAKLEKDFIADNPGGTTNESKGV